MRKPSGCSGAAVSWSGRFRGRGELGHGTDSSILLLFKVACFALAFGLSFFWQYRNNTGAGLSFGHVYFVYAVPLLFVFCGSALQPALEMVSFYPACVNTRVWKMGIVSHRHSTWPMCRPSPTVCQASCQASQIPGWGRQSWFTRKLRTYWNTQEPTGASLHLPDNSYGWKIVHGAEEIHRRTGQLCGAGQRGRRSVGEMREEPLMEP